MANLHLSYSMTLSRLLDTMPGADIKRSWLTTFDRTGGPPFGCEETTQGSGAGGRLRGQFQMDMLM
jgi:hypothetical protein